MATFLTRVEPVPATTPRGLRQRVKRWTKSNIPTSGTNRIDFEPIATTSVVLTTVTLNARATADASAPTKDL